MCYYIQLISVLLILTTQTIKAMQVAPGAVAEYTHESYQRTKATQVATGAVAEYRESYRKLMSGKQAKSGVRHSLIVFTKQHSLSEVITNFYLFLTSKHYIFQVGILSFYQPRDGKNFYRR